MIIGIPNTLFSAYHRPYWEKLLSLLNQEVVISNESNKEIAEIGGRLLPHEFCIPVKVFMGHVVQLVKKQVDLVLLPTMSSSKNVNFFCPKLIGLGEIVKYTVGLDEKSWFAPEICCNGLQINMIKPPQQKFTSSYRFKQIERQANDYWQKTLQKCQSEKLTLGETTGALKFNKTNKNLTVGLLGYAYTLYDPFISKGIVSKLANLGVALRTWEMVEQGLIEAQLKSLKRPIYWNFGKIICGAGLHFLKEPEIDGIIYVSAFGCGPDSIVTKLLSIEASQFQKPLLLVNLDDHVETGHIQTRLEAFVEMLSAGKEVNRSCQVI